MKIKTLLKAGLLGFAVSLSVAPMAGAQTLRVLSGGSAAPLAVAINRAVVVEVDQPFAEISIANPGIADISTLSDRSIYVLGKAPGRTTMTLLSPEGGLLANVELQVTPDVAELKERLQQIVPGENIEVRTANDGIVLSGVVSSIAKLDRAIDLAERYAPGRVSNLMVVGGTQQVMLKVRFAEVQRTVLKGLDGSFALGGTDVNAFTGGYLEGSALGGPWVADANQQGLLAIGGSIGGVALEMFFEALETKGMIRTLAEPNLTALSGQEAKFLAGGEYPVPTQQDDNTITVEYKPFGIEMNFTPRVVDGDIINIAMTAAVSSLDPNNGFDTGILRVDAFRKRETSTTVELRDGDSFAIAGLLQDDFRDNIAQVPWLGDIPILGTLFRSTEYQRNQTELVIVITPHLVTPVRGDAFALPTDRVSVPSENNLFLFGNVAGAPGDPNAGGAAEVARQDYNTPYGYVME